MARIGRTFLLILLLAIGFVAASFGTGLAVRAFRNVLSEPYLQLIRGTVNIVLTVGVIYLLQVKVDRKSGERGDRYGWDTAYPHPQAGPF